MRSDFSDKRKSGRGSGVLHILDAVQEALAEALRFVSQADDIAPPSVEGRAVLYVGIEEAAQVLLNLLLKLLDEHD